MRYNLNELLTAFDELLPLTDEEQKQFWLKSKRSDGISITLSFSVYDEEADIIIRPNEDVSAAVIHLASCQSINVVDIDRRVIEVVHTARNVSTRCVLALEGTNLLEVSAEG